MNCETLDELQYARLRGLALKYCRSHRVPDPEELADEAMLRLVSTAQQVDNVEGFLIVICRNVVLEEIRRLEAIKNLALPGEPEKPLRFDEDRYWECFAKLPKADQKLLKDYVGCAGDARVALAANYGISYDALRKRVERVRAQLRACMHELRDHDA